MANKKYYVVFAYNHDDNYDAQSIGIFSSLDSAKEEILNRIKEEYDKMEECDILQITDEWFSDEDEEYVPSRKDFLKILKKNLKCNECKGLSYLTYQIGVHSIQN